MQENFALISKVLDKYENGQDGNINALQLKRQPPKKLRLLFSSRLLSKKIMLLNIQEVTALFHFPEVSEEITNIYQVSSKKVKPPQDLPLSLLLKNYSISTFGLTNFRNQHLEFGIRREDRNRHLYIIGKTGMGKSKLIQLLVISDIYHNKGLCLIDPHGDLARDIIKYVPKERISDVIYFNPLDGEYPVGFNPLQCYSPEEKHQVVNGFIAIFKKLFAANWTNRLEHMLRFTVLALVEVEDSTVVDIVRILTDIEFRQQTVKKIQSPVVKNFWTHEFASWNEKFDNEAIIPIINIVGQFISNDYIRNVVAQKKSAFDFYKAMNEGKIVIINIAKGILGEDNAALLGSMIITKIQEATMARVNIPENERREFYLYVDEFQNFATESFNQILSEARKFNLSLTIAHQYIDQLSENIRKTVFGNIGSFICFRVGPEDAHYLGNEFAPQIKPDDLINLDVREIYLKISIKGKTSESFSANTISIPVSPKDYSDDIIKFNHLNYAERKDKIEELFNTENPHITSLIAEEGKASNLEGIEFEEPII